MVGVTLEGLWMVSDRIVDFRFFIKFDRSGYDRIVDFRFSSNLTGQDLQKFSVFKLSQSMLVIYHKAPNQGKHLSNCGCYSRRIVDGF